MKITHYFLLFSCIVLFVRSIKKNDDFTYQLSINVTNDYAQLLTGTQNQTHEVYVGYLPVGPTSA